MNRDPMRIDLSEVFYIDCNIKGYELKEKYIGRTKEGLPREGVRRHGYFSDLGSALMKYLRLNQLNGAEAVEIWELGKHVEQCNKRAVYKLQRILEVKEWERVAGVAST